MTSWHDKPVEIGLSIWNFPPSTDWPQHDIVGRGADLEPATLIHAYRSGVFPMSSDVPNRNPDMGWWSPMMRGVLPLDQLRITRSMRSSARKYSVRIDTCFERVVRGCAVPNREGGWITKDIIDAYITLHELGWAHSFETFDENGVLIGGLYGVRVTVSSPASRCFTSSKMHQRLHLCTSLQLCATRPCHCLMCNGSRPISRHLVQRKSPATITCVVLTRPSTPNLDV